MSNEPSKKLLNGCIQILEKYSESIHKPIKLEREDNYYSLKCKFPVLFYERENSYQIMRINETKNIGIHFALKFDIESTKKSNKIKSNFILTDANIKFIYLNDNNSNILFRAEFALNKNKPHAQPHWQFEPYITKAISNEDINTILELRNEEEEIFLDEESKNSTINISKIHFAMTSDWHLPKNKKNDNSVIVLLDENNVVNWLEGCLDYTKNQMRDI